MQGHFEDTNQPTPFSNISVNNPSRFTNANRVNRIGTIPVAEDQSNEPSKSNMSDDDQKPVLAISIATNGTITTQSLVDRPIAGPSTAATTGTTYRGGEDSNSGAGAETAASSAAFMANGTYVATMTVAGNNQEMPTLFNVTYSHGFN